MKLKSPKMTFFSLGLFFSLKRFTKFSAMDVFSLLLVWRYTDVRLNLVLSAMFSNLMLNNLPGMRCVVSHMLYV